MLTAALVVLAASAVTAPAARAGTWMQVSCVNPDGSAAPSEGWTGFAQGTTTPFGSGVNTNCDPGGPMSATLSDSGPAGQASEDLQYQPPAGATLVGGRIGVNLYADGGSTYARSEAVVLEPQFVNDSNDFIGGCVEGLGYCSGGNDLASAFTLPADRGGDLFVSAACLPLTNQSCSQYFSASHGGWAVAQVTWADLLLRTTATPVATGFSGSATQPGIGGTAHLVFTASDGNGPGIYLAAAFVDGRAVSVQVPSANDGLCVPVGSDPASGALMFDDQQPCPTTEPVDVAVPTAGLSDGPHELAVVVTDAAHAGATVFDQTITTSNPVPTPVPVTRGTVSARFTIHWHWQGIHTVLRSITAARVPRRAHLTVSCAGRGCPKLALRSARAGRLGRLLTELRGRRFRAGNRLLITVTRPPQAPERVELTIRRGRVPRARLLTR